MKGSTKKKIEGYIFIFPWIIGLSTFVIYPAGYGLVLGFFKFDIFNPPKWIALRNFQEMFTEDPNFLKSLSVTVRYIVFSVSLRVGAAFFLALLLNQKVKGLGAWRTLFYTPSIVAGYALALLWNRMMDPQYGRCAPPAEVSCTIDGAECGRWSFRSECVPGAERWNSGTVAG